MKHLLLIFLGGGAGTILRYYLGRFIQGYVTSGFPAGTLVINILACFVIGLLAGMIDSGFNLSAATRLLLITGFCGGLSTFSAFSIESVQLMQEEKYIYLILYIVLSLTLCLAATFAGMMLGSRL